MSPTLGLRFEVAFVEFQRWAAPTVAWNFDAHAYWVQYLHTIADNQVKYAGSNPHSGGRGVLGGISGVIPDYGCEAQPMARLAPTKSPTKSPKFISRTT